MLKKILFVYQAGRKERIDRLSCGQEAPTDFLYGLTYFDRRRFIPSFVEASSLVRKKFNPNYWKLIRSDNNFARLYGIGKSCHPFLGHIKYFNQFDVIIGTNDSLSLGLTYFKQTGQLHSKVLFLAMGSGRTLKRLRAVGNKGYVDYKRDFSAAMEHASGLVLLGQGEHEFLQEEYFEHKEKIRLIPFGVDIEFWTPKSRKNVLRTEEYCLFVGNDPNRDYELLIDVARFCPNQRFIFVSSKIPSNECPENVELLKGNIWESQLSDCELRKLYRGARLVLLPLKDTIQPSGQSVALQAMACATPVLITRTSGLWDDKIMKDMDNCLLVEPGQPRQIVSIIENLPSLRLGLKEIGTNGWATVQRYYPARKFADRLQSLIGEVLDK